MKIINAIINLSEFLHKFALFFFSSSHIEEEKVKILGTVYQYSTRVIYNTGAAIEGH